MWFSAIKLAVSAGSKIYANKQKSKIAMSDAQLLHAERQARGEEAYQGKLLEARQNDYKDEFVLVILSAPPIIVLRGESFQTIQQRWKKYSFLSNILQTADLVFYIMDPCSW